MPALVNRRFGESGSKLEEGTIVCFFSLKKSRNVRRISSAFIVVTSNIMARLNCIARAQHRRKKDTDRRQPVPTAAKSPLLCVFVEHCPNGIFELGVEFAVYLEHLFRCVSSLRQPLTLLGNPRTAPLQNILFQSQVEKRPHGR